MTTNSPQHSWPKNVYILIPSYKASQSLAALLPLLLQTIPAANIMVVDDASGDDTAKVCQGSAVALIAHQRNQGKGAALRSGFKRIMHTCDWIITMDADGQHSPQDLPAFLHTLQNNPHAGIIIGRRDLHPRSMPPARILSNRLTSGALSLLCGQPIYDAQCGYRAYATPFLRRINIEFNRFQMESEVILKATSLGYRVCFVAVQTLYFSGGSHIAHVRDTLRWIQAVVTLWLRLRYVKNRIQV
jgi:glycosyltransferase involved in cell wall biosynthesis